MERRIYGEENELGAIYKKKQEDNWEWERSDFVNLYGGAQLNGSDIYEDLKHIEIATAEASSARDIVLISKGCERLIEELGRKKGITFIKDNTEPKSDMKCFGAHENYMYYDPKGEFFRRKVVQQNLIAFLISRIIFTGGGITLNCYPGAGQFLLSNRARFLALIYGDSAQAPCPGLVGYANNGLYDGRPLIDTHRDRKSVV